MAVAFKGAEIFKLHKSIIMQKNDDYRKEAFQVF